MSPARNELISLFCGPGGFDQGFKEAGFVTRLAIDKDIAAVKTHRQNHPEADALVLELADEQRVFDFLWDQCRVRFRGIPVGIIGGPPCQSFSVGNAYKKDEDPRDGLPAVYAKLILDLNRRYKQKVNFFVFENVTALKKTHTAQYLAFKQACEADFHVFEGELDAQNFGVPQVRKRVFIVGINKKQHKQFGSKTGKRQFAFPQGNDQPLPCGSVFSRVTQPAIIADTGLTGEDVREIAGHWNHWCMDPISAKFRADVQFRQHNGKQYRVVEVDRNKAQLARLMGGKSFKVLDPDKPSYTVAYGHREVHLHPKGHRRLSVYEAMQLQGFPEQYRMEGSLSDQIRLVSEVVSPPVARAIAQQIIKELALQVAPEAGG